MSERAGRDAPTGGKAANPSRRRHWGRLILLVVVILAVVTVAAIGAYVGLSADPPLALHGTAAAPVGALDGTWRVGPGSQAGFRIQQTVLAMTGDVTGRTDVVTGSLDIAGGQVTGGTFSVDLTTIKANGKASPQFAQTLETTRYPTATVALAAPVELSPTFAAGGTMTTTAAARMTIHGVTRAVTLSVSGRRDGSAVQIAGTVPVAFADWGLKSPNGYGLLGSLADHGVAEFLLVLSRA